MGKNGGKRPGAGRPVGTLNADTLRKAAARKKILAIFEENLDVMVRAQVANACGINHFFLRDERGQFVQVMDPKAIEIALNSGEKDKTFWIHTKDPSTQAFTALADRAIDKPVEPAQDVNVQGDIRIRWEE